MEGILKYIQEKYDPLSIILYGSYADGTNNLNSDFDALVITSGQEQLHDTSLVGGIPLDVFVYPSNFLMENMRARILSRSMTAASLQTPTELEGCCKKRCKPIYGAVR